MPDWLLRVLVFASALTLFVPVRWHVWGGRLKDHRWKVTSLTFGQMVAAERKHPVRSVAVWSAILALLTWMAT